MATKLIKPLINCIKMPLLVVVSLFVLCFVAVSDSHAAEVDFSGEPVTHQVTLTNFCLRWNSTTNYTCGRVHTGSFNEISSVDFYPNIAYQLPVGAYYMDVYYNLGATSSVPNNSLWFGGPNSATYNATSSIMDFLSSEQVSSTSSDLTYRSYRSIFKYAGGTLLGPSNTIRMSNNGGMFATESMRITSVVFWRVNNSGASNQDIINSINSQSSTLNSINSGISDVNDNINDLRSVQEQANDDANDRYQDEKDTINDNGDNAVDSWDDAQSNLTFQAPTFLFGWLWSLGSVEDCVDISVLASLIHSTETQYCTWYPTSIRSIISPIINIFLICLISGFVFSWLKKGGV